ncbi:hypothetical protein, partial [Mangrovactinospora gilvigrisea]|uniref:hypothetical protein n=1 Tax=Mangrovactinospora gilvigrisea TaxID=1428644 RepID=UPI001FE9812C
MPQSEVDGLPPVPGTRHDRKPGIGIENRPHTGRDQRLIIGEKHPQRRHRTPSSKPAGRAAKRIRARAAPAS